MTLKNYYEALTHFYDVEMLNEKGLRDYIKILRTKLIDAECRIIALENELKLAGRKR